MLRRLPRTTDPSILSGFHAAEDVGVVRLADDLALCQTVDFFTPIVDEPRDFGAIAAANSLSDLYAAGARPLTALSILCYPEGDDLETLEAILLGGEEKVREAGAHLIGGHSVADDEIKFGLAVTGIAHPDRFLMNSGARPGDLLVLTKRLGTGILSTAIKAGKAPAETLAAGIRQMTALNRDASIAMLEAGAHAATDVTGYGLLGHAFEMAAASGVTVVLEAERLPLLTGILPMAARKRFRTKGSRTNRSYVGAALRVERNVPEELVELALDPQTSGGLLISLPADRLPVLAGALEGSEALAEPVGRVSEERPGLRVHLVRSAD